MSVRVCSIFSGSSGNCTYIENGDRAILIDAGGSLRSIKQNIESVGGSIERVCGVFVTHEHGDHIRGIKALVNKYKLPVISNKKTLGEIVKSFPDIDLNCLVVSEPGETAQAEDFCVKSFPVPHDSVCAVGYSVTSGNKRIVVATDMGHITDVYLENALGADCAVIEANYDYNMLRQGAYPPYLKSRILSEHGHLDNELSGEAVARLVKSGTEKILLAHLSKDNNTPAVARESVCRILSMYGISEGSDVLLGVAPRFDPSKALCL